ncbi:MAG: hypothetical protein IPM42_00980 [Saprospiraceae bacterium]|nr:hypothetical protein [Saprospiraceae bacterium]
MKSIKFFATFMAVILFTGLSNASDVVSFKKPENAQIQKYLTKVDFTGFIKEETKLNITFMVNHQNEIIVVSTSNVNLDNVIKSTLNYKKLDMSNLEYNVLYTLPVTIM